MQWNTRRKTPGLIASVCGHLSSSAPGTGIQASSGDAQRTPPGTTPRVRRFPHDAMEGAGEVRLVAHAAPDGNRAERLRGPQHESLGDLNASAEYIVPRRYAERAFEGTTEVARAEAEETGELLNGNSPGQVGTNMRDNPAGLPCWQAAPHRPGVYFRQQRDWPRVAARHVTKQCDGVRNVRPGGVAVAAAGPTCSLGELRCDV